MLGSDLLESIRRQTALLREHAQPMLQRIHVTRAAVRTVEDWSGVRSPGRAARRRAKHPQRIIVQRGVPSILKVGTVMYIHPEKWTAFLKQQAATMVSNSITQTDSFLGIPVTFEDRRYGQL